MAEEKESRKDQVFRWLCELRNAGKLQIHRVNQRSMLTSRNPRAQVVQYSPDKISVTVRSDDSVIFTVYDT